MSDHQRIAGVILAGGRAERMGGHDKGLLLLANRPMVAYVANALGPQVAELIINANRNLDAYKVFGYPVVSDAGEGFQGPLAGMLAALNAAHSAALVLTAPCDSPLLPCDYARRMADALLGDEAELSVAYDGCRLQPVFALLRMELRDSLSDYLGSGQRKIDRWFTRHRMARTDFSDSPAMFRNINTPEELACLEREIGNQSLP